MGPRDTACQPLPQLWANSINVLCNVVICPSRPTEVGGKVRIQMRVRILFVRVFLSVFVCMVLGMCELPGSTTVALLKFPWNFKSS